MMIKNLMIFIFCFFPNRHTKEYKECSIVPTLGKYAKQEISWVFQKNSPYLNIFNFYFHKFKENGIWNSIEDRYKIQPQVCPDLSGQPIEYSSCISAFLTLFLGFIISSFLMTMECGKVKCNKHVSKNCQDSNISEVTESEIEEKISSHYDTITDYLDRISGHYDNISSLKIHLQHIRNTKEDSTKRIPEEEK